MIIKTNLISRIFKIFGINNNAFTFGPIIFIKPELADRQDIIEHEKVHIVQFKKQPFTFWIRYLFSRKARFNYECEAFAVQIMYLFNNQHIELDKLFDRFTNDLWNEYYPGSMTFGEIEKLLIKAYQKLRIDSGVH